MTSEDRRFFSGETLEQAVMQAARHHGIDPDRVAWKRVERRHGFLRERRGVVIDVDPNAPERPAVADFAEDFDTSDEHDAAQGEARGAEERPTGRGRKARGGSSPVKQARRLTPIEMPAGAIEAAQKALEDIFALASLDLEATISETEGELEIELRGVSEATLLEDRGSLLLAIQHLLPRLIRGHLGTAVPCRVDAGNFHEEREEELRGLAHSVAQKVRDRGHPEVLRPMNPAERRIIHVTLADDPEVVTESEGSGFFKRVTVRPAMRRPRGFNPY